MPYRRSATPEAQVKKAELSCPSSRTLPEMQSPQSEGAPESEDDDIYQTYLREQCFRCNNTFRADNTAIPTRRYPRASRNCVATRHKGSRLVRRMTPSTKLPCPFLIRSRERHAKCTGRAFAGTYSLQSHIWREHRQPFHCPICYLVFDTVKERDGHIRERSCIRQATPDNMEGIAAEDFKQFAHCADPNLSHIHQWYAIWDMLFPGSERPPSPYHEEATASGPRT